MSNEVRHPAPQEHLFPRDPRLSPRMTQALIRQIDTEGELARIVSIDIIHIREDAILHSIDIGALLSRLVDISWERDECL